MRTKQSADLKKGLQKTYDDFSRKYELEKQEMLLGMNPEHLKDFTFYLFNQNYQKKLPDKDLDEAVKYIVNAKVNKIMNDLGDDKDVGKIKYALEKEFKPTKDTQTDFVQLAGKLSEEKDLFLKDPGFIEKYFGWLIKLFTGNTRREVENNRKLEITSILDLNEVKIKTIASHLIKKPDAFQKSTEEVKNSGINTISIAHKPGKNVNWFEKQPRRDNRSLEEITKVLVNKKGQIKLLEKKLSSDFQFIMRAIEILQSKNKLTQSIVNKITKVEQIEKNMNIIQNNRRNIDRLNNLGTDRKKLTEEIINETKTLLEQKNNLKDAEKYTLDKINAFKEFEKTFKELIREKDELNLKRFSAFINSESAVKDEGKREVLGSVFMEEILGEKIKYRIELDENGTNKIYSKDVKGEKGSAQTLSEIKDLEDRLKSKGNNKFAKDYYKILISSFLMGSADCHMGNVMLVKDQKGQKLVPIDFGFSLVEMKNMTKQVIENITRHKDGDNTSFYLTEMKKLNPTAFEAASYEVSKTYLGSRNKIQETIRDHCKALGISKDEENVVLKTIDNNLENGKRKGFLMDKIKIIKYEQDNGIKKALSHSLFP